MPLTTALLAETLRRTSRSRVALAAVASAATQATHTLGAVASRVASRRGFADAPEPNKNTADARSSPDADVTPENKPQADMSIPHRELFEGVVSEATKSDVATEVEIESSDGQPGLGINAGAIKLRSSLKGRPAGLETPKDQRRPV